MIKNIVQTVGSKLVVAVISFCILLLNSNFLGLEGLGSVGLLVLSITIILLISNLVHTGIVFYASRYSSANLFWISYLWSFISLGLAVLFQAATGLFPEDMASDIYFLSFLQSGIVIHLNLLLGKERIYSYNLFSLLQSLFTISFLLVQIFYYNNSSISAFINSLYFAYGLTLLLSLFSLIKELKGFQFKELGSIFKATISYGFFVQSANIFQLLNYRISYFILDAFSGRASLGLYTASVQISEALLLPGKSISTVQYARISARKEQAYAQRISLLFMKLSVLLSSLGTLVLLLLPSSFFEFLLGEGFGVIKYTILAMSLGILALSAEIILSHYFSGTGRQQKNSLSSLIGLLLTLAFSFLLIPKYGAIGAAMTSSIAFSGMLIFLVVLMSKHEGMKLSLFLPQKSDIRLISRILRRYSI